MSEQNTAIYNRVTEEIWNQKNPALIEEIYATDCVIHTSGGVLHGRSGYRQLYDTYTRAFPDCQVIIEDSLVGGDKVMLHYTFAGTHTGELMGIAPSGKPVSVQGTAFARFAGGQIVEETTIWDTLGLVQQIGAVPALGQAAGAD
jgi:steroid delta-isomerase-like uncharacterized protein